MPEELNTQNANIAEGLDPNVAALLPAVSQLSNAKKRAALQIVGSALQGHQVDLSTGGLSQQQVLNMRKEYQTQIIEIEEMLKTARSEGIKTGLDLQKAQNDLSAAAYTLAAADMQSKSPAAAALVRAHGDEMGRLRGEQAEMKSWSGTAYSTQAAQSAFADLDALIPSRSDTAMGESPAQLQSLTMGISELTNSGLTDAEISAVISDVGESLSRAGYKGTVSSLLSSDAIGTEARGDLADIDARRFENLMRGEEITLDIQKTDKDAREAIYAVGGASSALKRIWDAEDEYQKQTDASDAGGRKVRALDDAIYNAMDPEQRARLEGDLTLLRNMRDSLEVGDTRPEAVKRKSAIKNSAQFKAWSEQKGYIPGQEDEAYQAFLGEAKQTLRSLNRTQRRKMLYGTDKEPTTLGVPAEGDLQAAAAANVPSLNARATSGATAPTDGGTVFEEVMRKAAAQKERAQATLGERKEVLLKRFGVKNANE